MKRYLTAFCICLGALGTAPAMFADVTDYLLNVNGNTYCPSFTTVGGCATTGFAGAGASAPANISASGGTGLGTVSLTFNPGAAGSYNVDLWLFEQLSQPGYNEYGNTGGSPVAGQSWQIDVPDYDYVGELGTAGAGSIIANTQADTLSDTNYIPGTDSSFAGGGFCATFPDANCDDYTSLAMGFDFTLASSEEEKITFTVSTVAPSSGFFLEQIHPVDGANASEIDYFLTGSATTESTVVNNGNVPEPSSWILLGTLAVLLFARFRKASSAV